MRQIAQFLGKVFRSAGRISKGTARGLLRHGTASLAKKAVQSLRIPIGNGRYLAYENLNKAEQEVVDEVVKYANHFAHEYVEHHEEAAKSRQGVKDMDQILMSHADELMSAGARALDRYVRSAIYDDATGEVKRVAVFQDEDILKQLVLAVIQEIEYQFTENADQG